MAARCEDVVSSDAHTCQADVTFNAANASVLGVSVRFSNSADSRYNGGNTTSGDEDRLSKRVEGVGTALNSRTHDLATGTHVVSYEINSNDDHILIVAGDTALTDMDGSNTGQVRGGIIGRNSVSIIEWDNWSLTDEDEETKKAHMWWF